MIVRLSLWLGAGRGRRRARRGSATGSESRRAQLAVRRHGAAAAGHTRPETSRDDPRPPTAQPRPRVALPDAVSLLSLPRRRQPEPPHPLARTRSARSLTPTTGSHSPATTPPGDTAAPFAQLGHSLNLPQTAILSLQGPERVPLLEEEAYQWWDSFTELGERAPAPPRPPLPRARDLRNSEASLSLARSHAC